MQNSFRKSVYAVLLYCHTSVIPSHISILELELPQVIQLQRHSDIAPQFPCHCSNDDDDNNNNNNNNNNNKWLTAPKGATPVN